MLLAGNVSANRRYVWGWQLYQALAYQFHVRCLLADFFKSGGGGKGGGVITSSMAAKQASAVCGDVAVVLPTKAVILSQTVMFSLSWPSVKRTWLTFILVIVLPLYVMLHDIFPADIVTSYF